MIDPIVHVSDTIALVGGSTITSKDLNTLQSLSQGLVAADGGADHLLAAGMVPDAVIGDLDSISHLAKTAFVGVLHPVTEQDTTDFEKALTRIAAPLILAAGFLGGRIDHTLSVFNVLARYPDKKVLLLSQDDICFLAAAATTRLTLPKGTRIGLMPLSETRVRTTGLRWDIADQGMHPTGLVSSSNAASGGKVTIASSGTLLITLPRSALHAAIAAVRG